MARILNTNCQSEIWKLSTASYHKVTDKSTSFTIDTNDGFPNFYWCTDELFIDLFSFVFSLIFTSVLVEECYECAERSLAAPIAVLSLTIAFMLL